MHSRPTTHRYDAARPYLGSKVELQLSDKDGKAICTHGGALKNKDPDYKVDYLMHANNKNWACMGEGSFGCGAMGAMTTGKLNGVCDGLDG